MAYSSPFHIIHYFGAVDPSEDPDFRRLQKKFLAEFNLPGNTFLTINHTEYSKDDIIKFIDDLQGKSPTLVHRAIFEHKATLSFFENPKAPLELEEVIRFLNAMVNHVDREKLQQLLLETMRENCKHHLSMHDYKAYRENLILLDHLQKFQEMQLLEVVRKELFKLVYFFSSYYEKNSKTSDMEEKLVQDVAFLWSEDFTEFMNELPEEFEEVEQALNETLLYFVAYSVNHYELRPAFYYRLIDTLLNLESLDRYTRNQLYKYRDDIQEYEQQERELRDDIVRTPDEHGGKIIVSSMRAEMSEERKALLKKKVDREFFLTRVIKMIALLMGVCMILAAILAPLEKLSIDLFIAALALFFVLVLFWVRTFFVK